MQLLAVQTSVTALPGQRAVDLYNSIDQFWSQLPVVRCLRAPGLRDRHWRRMCDVTHISAEIDRKQLTLDQILNLGMERHLDVLTDMSNMATTESMLEKVRVPGLV